MNCPDCDKEVHGSVCSCGWARSGSNKIIWRNTEHEMPNDCITKEQFGLTLYNAIMLIGGIKQLRMFRGYVAMGDLPQTDEYKLKEAKLIEQLKTALVALKSDEVTDVVSEYPWVATL